MKATEETKMKAKAAGIKSWHVKSEETLLAELDAPVVETAKPEPLKTVDTTDLLDLIDDTGWSGADFSIRIMGEKSPFWPFKDIVIEKAKKDYDKRKKK